MKYTRIVSVIFILFFVTNIVFIVNVTACKDIVACGDATAGDYNLLLKVRDPSRPDLQVLCIVPEGYEYTYHNPWTGRPMDFKVEHKFIGVVSIDDAIPNIFKAGMVFSESGIAFGDADTGSNWRNPTRYAWDDFDWMRYACEKADDEDEAVGLLTQDIIDQMHAPGISENLFVVGPKKAFVIEADAFHYDVKEVTGFVPMSTYPKELWKTQVLRKLPIALSFDIKKDEYVRRGGIIRLNSLYGIKVVYIGKDWIIACQVPFLKIAYGINMFVGKPVKIELAERKTVGDFSVELLDIDGNKARISLCFMYKAWEDIMMNYVQSRYGSITVKDMMNWSRLHENDLDGLRPMCEDRCTYEAAMIYKIPKENFETLSSGWFAANHPCSSIYVPVHICDTDIYGPYKEGDAAALSLELLNRYGHDTLTLYFNRVEDVLIYENEVREKIANDMIADNKNVSDFLTITDMGMQQQAWMTEEIWMEASNISDEKDKHEVIDIIGSIWEKNYSISLERMQNAISALEDISEAKAIIDKIGKIMLVINELK